MITKADTFSNNAQLRQLIYQGQIFLFPATQCSLELIDQVKMSLISELGENYREAQFHYSADDFFTRIGRLRKTFYSHAPYHELLRKILTQMHFSKSENAFDPFRIRVIMHEGHKNPNAKPVYHGHRDTWYANPQTQITWWIPIDDITQEESFVFWPDYFKAQVNNDSELFDHDQWMAVDNNKKIGWQDKNTGLKAVYPDLLEEIETVNEIPVIAKAGEILMFSGQHLHKTNEQMTGRTRFSIDFRTVHLEDEAQQLGPKNIDNRSTGSSLGSHIYPDN